MRVAVVGANGRTGRLVVEEALRRGHQVVALVRRAGDLPTSDALRVVVDALSGTDRLRLALSDVDVVICCLGTRRHKPKDLMRKNLPLIIRAMEQAGPAHLIVLSAYGVGDTAKTASLVARFLYATLFRSIFRDKQQAEIDLRRSGIDWTLVYPVGLTDDPPIAVDLRPVAEVKSVEGLPTVPRASVAAALLNLAEDRRTGRREWLISSCGSAH